MQTTPTPLMQLIYNGIIYICKILRVRVCKYECHARCVNWQPWIQVSAVWCKLSIIRRLVTCNLQLILEQIWIFLHKTRFRLLPSMLNPHIFDLMIFWIPKQRCAFFSFRVNHWNSAITTVFFFPPRFAGAAECCFLCESVIDCMKYDVRTLYLKTKTVRN